MSSALCCMYACLLPYASVLHAARPEGVGAPRRPPKVAAGASVLLLLCMQQQQQAQLLPLLQLVWRMGAAEQSSRHAMHAGLCGSALGGGLQG